jgi:cytochrome bd ubiquinol oxidase subunit II
MGLAVVWFVLVALLWTGFFVLEGFDFGVGMLHTGVGRSDEERQLALDSIGPLWDGNEVWLIVAGAAMFAAFPGWYATMFSGFYLALVLLLAALIVRGVSFEYRDKRESARWRRTWSLLTTFGSLIAPFVIGIALGDLLRGVPIDAQQNFTGDLLDLFSPYSVFVGLTVVALCVTHGATFLALKVDGQVRERARTVARRTAPVTALAVLAFVLWTQGVTGRGVIPGLVPAVGVLAAAATALLVRRGQEGWAFTSTTVAMAATISTIFLSLYPHVMVSSSGSQFDLTVQNTASSSYALTVMTIVAAVFFPLVLVYQGWTYYVFRRRLQLSGYGPPPVPGQPGSPEQRAAPVAGR